MRTTRRDGSSGSPSWTEKGDREGSAADTGLLPCSWNALKSHEAILKDLGADIACIQGASCRLSHFDLQLTPLHRDQDYSRTDGQDSRMYDGLRLVLLLLPPIGQGHPRNRHLHEALDLRPPQRGGGHQLGSRSCCCSNVEADRRIPHELG